MAERGSWQLKVDRAEKHLVELEDEITRYSGRHAYRAERDYSEKDRDIWSYVLRITEQPDPNLAVIAGDVIHNLRSALDHLAVAIQPRSRRRKAGFPIEFIDIWEKDESGSYVINDEEARDRYWSKVKGAPPEALTIIEELQPFAVMEGTAGGSKRHPLGILSRLDNADKHRELIVIATALTGVETVARWKGSVINQPLPEQNPHLGPVFADDGTEIARFGFSRSPAPRESEVNVQVNGTPCIAVDVGLDYGYVVLADGLRATIDGLRVAVFPPLEPFVR